MRVRRGVVAATAIVAHASALRGGYVWLDHAHIEDGAALASPSGWPALFTGGFAGTGYYRPLTALSLSVDGLFHSAFVFHFSNVLWHAAASVLVAVAAEALGLSRRAATIAGALFAVHPIGTLAAAAIAFRSESMVVVAIMTLLIAHAGRRPAVAAGAILLGALAKETVLAFAPLAILAMAPRLGREERRRMFAFEGVAWCLAFGLRLAFAPSWRAPYPAMGWVDAIGTRAAALAKSALMIAVPFDRTICDAFPITPVTAPAALAGVGVFALAVWFAWKRRGPALLLAFALLPALQLVPVMRWWSPHYVHLAVAFAAMLVGETADRLGIHASRAIVVAICLFGGVTFHEDKRFRDDKALWTKEAAVHPACREAHFYLGEAARKGHHLKAAGMHYEEALIERPRILAYVDRVAALQNLGIVRLEQRAYPAARRAFLEALEGTTDPRRRFELTHNLSIAEAYDR